MVFFCSRRKYKPIVEATKIRATMNISTTNLWSDSFLEKQARIQIGSIYLCGTKGFSIQ